MNFKNHPMEIKKSTYQKALNSLASKYNDMEFKEDNSKNRVIIKDLKEQIDFMIKSFPYLEKPILNNYGNTNNSTSHQRNY